MSWALARKAAPYVIIGLLVIAALWLRNDVTRLAGERDAARVQVTAVTDANKSLKSSLDVIEAARADNDRLMLALTEARETNRDTEIRTNTIIREAAANDPIVHDWLATSVPDGVRQALRAGARGGDPQ